VLLHPGDLVVGEHVGDQGAGRVEVEDRLERRGVGQQVVAGRHGLDQQQHRRRRVAVLVSRLVGLTLRRPERDAS
jgi:hypothetical protein